MYLYKTKFYLRKNYYKTHLQSRGEENILINYFNEKYSNPRTNL